MTTYNQARDAATLALATFLAKGREAELVETADFFTIKVDGVELPRSYPFTITAAELAAMETQLGEFRAMLVELRATETDLWNAARELDDADPRQAEMGQAWMQARVDISRVGMCIAQIMNTLDNQTFAALR